MSWYDLSVSRKGQYPFVKIDITKPREWVPLVFLSDAHVGAKTFRRKEFLRMVGLAKDMDAIVILLGDMIENANKTSVGAGCYEQTLTPDQQCDWIEEHLMPIKNQIVGAVTGNHEWRTYKGDGHKATKSYLKGLGLTGPNAERDLYLGFEFWGAIGQNNKTYSRAYTVYGTHSLSASKNSSLELNAMGRDWSFINADILAKGHGHGMDHTPAVEYQMSPSNAAVSEVWKHYILTGNWLGREDSYAAQKPLSPKPVGTVMAWLKMNGQKKRVITEKLYDGQREERPEMAA